ncbi:glycosyltransferase family 4 protein [Aureispira]|nr:glycosyltransferase family 4 protein [Aureispira sp.]
MRILFFTHGADMMGANRCLLDLLTGLIPYGITPIVVVPGNGELEIELKKRSIKCIVFKYFNLAHTKYISVNYWFNSLRQFQNKYQYLPAIIDEVKNLDIDIVYTNSSTIGIGAWLAEALQLPHVWHIREFGEKDYGLVFWRGRNYFDYWANKARLIISMSYAIEKEVLRNITTQKVTIHDGIISEENFSSITPKYEHTNGNFTFLIIGLIHPTKGQMTALKCFHEVYKKNKHVRLIIAGKGRRLYTKKIKSYIAQHQLNSVVNFIGYTNNPYSVHQQADAVLMCSKSEGMGRVTIEGMIFGNPVIGYNGGATPELIEKGVDGLIYNSPQQLIQHMDFLARNPKTAEEYGRNGRTKAGKNFLIKDFVKQVYMYLAEIPTKK